MLCEKLFIILLILHPAFSQRRPKVKLLLDVIIYPTDCCPMLGIRGTYDFNVFIREDAKGQPFMMSMWRQPFLLVLIKTLSRGPTRAWTLAFQLGIQEWWPQHHSYWSNAFLKTQFDVKTCKIAAKIEYFKYKVQLTSPQTTASQATQIWKWTTRAKLRRDFQNLNNVRKKEWMNFLLLYSAYNVF